MSNVVNTTMLIVGQSYKDNDDQMWVFLGTGSNGFMVFVRYVDPERVFSNATLFKTPEMDTIRAKFPEINAALAEIETVNEDIPDIEEEIEE